jgi:L,D-peptidoglycan transpeptidase YkuD (ErfK/YbiS/YcfS/YnhG family)
MSSTLFTRRAFVGASLAGLFISAAASEETAPVNLTYRGGRLKWPGGETRAAIGKAGITDKKREGDLATPAGDFPLLEMFYRDDRIDAPKTALPIRALKEGDAWVDDPRDSKYNRLVSLPYPAHVERLWRTDEIYNLLIVIGYNMAPTVPGAGSAYFHPHCASELFADRWLHRHRAREAAASNSVPECKEPDQD